MRSKTINFERLRQEAKAYPRKAMERGGYMSEPDYANRGVKYETFDLVYNSQCDKETDMEAGSELATFCDLTLLNSIGKLAKASVKWGCSKEWQDTVVRLLWYPPQEVLDQPPHYDISLMTKPMGSACYDDSNPEGVLSKPQPIFVGTGLEYLRGLSPLAHKFQANAINKRFAVVVFATMSYDTPKYWGWCERRGYLPDRYANKITPEPMQYQTTFSEFVKNQRRCGTYCAQLIAPFSSPSALAVAQGYFLSCIIEEITEFFEAEEPHDAALELADIALFLEALYYTFPGHNDNSFCLSSDTVPLKLRDNSLSGAIAALMHLCPDRKTWKLGTTDPNPELLAQWFVAFLDLRAREANYPTANIILAIEHKRKINKNRRDRNA